MASIPISRPVISASVLIAACLLANGPASAETIDPAKRYRDCMVLARQNPDKGFDAALAWKGLGGGDAAEHCLAIALMGLEIYDQAARRLEALAQRGRAEAPRKAALLAQAAQAWLLAGNAQRANDVLGAAIALAAEDPELWIDRAGARAALGRYAEAVQDLDRALAISPGRADALALRASAKRRLGDIPGARADADAALAREPGSMEALLERGILRRAGGDAAGARADWLAILKIAPNSPAGRAAAQNLEALDVKKP